MARTLEQIEHEVMALPDEQRLELAERIRASVGIDADIERAWLAEAERRNARMLSGEDPGLNLEEFFSDDHE
jgi:hypothetical protein